MRLVKHILLWLIATILFTFASFGVELWEGNKIMTTEYYGYRNIGFVFVFIIYMLSTMLYPIVLLPLSWVVRKIANPHISRMLIVILSGMGGYVYFYKSYADRFIEEYHLNDRTAIILFSVAGFLYALVDWYLDREVDKADNN